MFNFLWVYIYPFRIGRYRRIHKRYSSAAAFSFSSQVNRQRLKCSACNYLHRKVLTNCSQVYNSHRCRFTSGQYYRKWSPDCQIKIFVYIYKSLPNAAVMYIWFVGKKYSLVFQFSCIYCFFYFKLFVWLYNYHSSGNKSLFYSIKYYKDFE